MIKYNKQNIKILTPMGYKRFDGIRRLHEPCIEMSTANFSLTCTLLHPICVNYFSNIYLPACDIDIGVNVFTLSGYEPIISKRDLPTSYVYDILGVEDAAAYFSNGVLSHNCVFLQHGDGAIDHEYFDKLMKAVKQPIGIYDDGAYRIFEEPKNDRIYAAGVDTAEGIGKDYSIINIYDLTDLSSIEQVAVYSSNKISPYDFTTKVHEILSQWGKPLALVERNGVGAQVADNLRNRFFYEKLVNWGGQLANRKQQNGMISHSNTKGKAVTNMRYWVSELKCVKFNDIETIREFRDFTRYPNGSWAAKDGCHDDKVMSTIWALMALYDEIVQQYFEIAETDDNNKPKKLVVTEFGMNLVVNSKSLYADNELFKQDISTLPCVFGIGDPIGSDINMLEQEGWTIL